MFCLRKEIHGILQKRKTKPHNPKSKEIDAICSLRLQLEQTANEPFVFNKWGSGAGKAKASTYGERYRWD
jgi:hypothetical protein